MNSQTPPSMATLVLLSSLSILSLNMFAPSLTSMAGYFEVSYGMMSLAVGGYLGITAVLQLILGPLSDLYGRRPVLIASFGIFTLASIGCALSTSIEWFLVFRLLQGAVISGMALSRAVIRDMVEEKDAASKMAYVNMAVAIAPMLGPLLGGLLEQFFGWRSSFVVYFVFGSAMTFLIWQDLGETNTKRSATFGEQFESYPELFRSRRFWGYSICLATSVGGFYTFTAGAPLVAQAVFNMSPAILGLCMGTISFGFFLSSFASTRMSKTYGLTEMMIIGRSLTCIGLGCGLLLLLMGFVSPLTLFASTFFVGLGNGITLPSASVGTMSVRPELAGSASGLSGALTVAAGAVLTTGTGAILTVENGSYMLVAIILATTVLGLLSAIFVRRVERQMGIIH